MPGIPRPKILTAIIVPTGGWDLKVDLSASSQYDTTVTCTVAAGTYYMSGDNQTDDFLFEFATKLQAAVRGVTEYGGGGDDVVIICDLTSANKVRISFDGAAGVQNDIKLKWSHADSDDDIAWALGFDHTADDASTSPDHPVFTGDYQASGIWMATEDGQLESLLVEDVSITDTLQSTALSGRVKSQQIASRYTNELKLQYLTRANTFTRGIGYGGTNVAPYEKNEGLESWWNVAMTGRQFRVYRDGYLDNSRSLYSGTSTASNTTTLTNSGASYDTDPQAYAGMLLQIDEYAYTTGATDMVQRWYISSHSATVITVANAAPAGKNIAVESTSYRIFDARYQTYVVDISKMSEFAPSEIPAIDRYNITIPLKRYV